MNTKKMKTRTRMEIVEEFSVFPVCKKCAIKKVTILSEASPLYNHQHRGASLSPASVPAVTINYI